MQKLKIVISVILFLIVSNVWVRANQDSSFTNLIKERQKCVTLIVDKKKNPLGTGFVTYYTGLKGSTKVGVITNWHVIEGQDSVYVRFNTRKGFQDIYALVVPREDMRKVMLAEVDLVLLAPVLKIEDIKEWEFTYPLGRDQYAKTGDIEEGDKLFYLGFPLGLGVGSRSHPLMREGYVSQKVEGAKTFLIDGFASHGNSGSPVFLAKDGKLVGVIVGFWPDYITAENKQEGLKMQLPYNSGIAEVITSDEILRIENELVPRIDKLLEQAPKAP